MVVVRLNNCSLNILKLLHKINLKFLDTNKSTNKFFWCPTGWGNAKIMGVNKNLLNFSGLIKPTSLLQSSRCFRQKNFLFLYIWVLRFCPSWQKFILSSRFQGFALLRLLLHLAAPCNSEIPASCRKNSKPRWQGKMWPYSFHEVNPAWNLATLQNSLSLWTKNEQRQTS